MSSFGIAILPVLIIGAMVGMIFLMFRIRHRFMSLKFTYWLLFLYAVLLLAATAAAPFVTTVVDAEKKAGQGDHHEIVDDLHKKLASGRVAEIDPKYVMKESYYDEFTADTLNIDVGSGIESSQIFVETKEENDRKIEFYIYGRELTVDNIDFSEKLEPYRSELAGDTLYITPFQQKITISIASDSFPVRQRTGEPFMNHSFSTGGQILYLRVPADVKVKAGENVYLEYVND